MWNSPSFRFNRILSKLPSIDDVFPTDLNIQRPENTNNFRQRRNTSDTYRTEQRKGADEDKLIRTSNGGDSSNTEPKILIPGRKTPSKSNTQSEENHFQSPYSGTAKPVKIIVFRSTKGVDGRYGVVFGPGSLGITLQTTRCGKGVYVQDVLVRFFCQAAPAILAETSPYGSAELLPEETPLVSCEDILRVGDSLIEIGGIDVTSKDLAEVLDLIMSLDRPLKIVLQEARVQAEISFSEVMEDPRKVPILFHFLLEEGETGSILQAKLMFWLEARQYFDQWKWLRPQMRRMGALRILRKFFEEGCPFKISNIMKDRQIQELLAQLENNNTKDIPKDYFLEAQKTVEKEFVGENGGFQKFLESPWVLRMTAHLQGSPPFIPLDLERLFENSAAFCMLQLFIIKSHPCRLALLKCWKRLVNLVNPLVESPRLLLNQDTKNTFLRELRSIWEIFLVPGAAKMTVEMYNQTRQQLLNYSDVFTDDKPVPDATLKELLELYLQVESELFVTLAGEILPGFLEGDLYEKFCQDVAESKNAETQTSPSRTSTETPSRPKSPRSSPMTQRILLMDSRNSYNGKDYGEVEVRKGFLNRMIRATQLPEQYAVHRTAGEERRITEDTPKASSTIKRLINLFGSPRKDGLVEEPSGLVSPVDCLVYFETDIPQQDSNEQPSVKIKFTVNMGAEQVDLPQKLEDFLVPYPERPLYRTACPPPKLFNIVVRGKEHSLLYGACLLLHHPFSAEECVCQPLADILKEESGTSVFHRENWRKQSDASSQLGVPQDDRLLSQSSLPAAPESRKQSPLPLPGQDARRPQPPRSRLALLQRFRDLEVSDLLFGSSLSSSQQGERTQLEMEDRVTSSKQKSMNTSHGGKSESLSLSDSSYPKDGSIRGSSTFFDFGISTKSVVHEDAQDPAESMLSFVATGICVFSQFPLVNQLRKVLIDFYTENSGSLFDPDSLKIGATTCFGNGEVGEKRFERWKNMQAEDFRILTAGIIEQHIIHPNKFDAMNTGCLQVDFDLNLVFKCLSIEHVLLVFIALLTESKVVLHSQNCSTLTIVAETFRAFLRVLGWCHIYVPIVPSHMVDQLLQCPTPYFIGVRCEQIEFPPDVVNVDLDNNVLQFPPDFCGYSRFFDALYQSLADLIRPLKYLSDSLIWDGNSTASSQTIESCKILAVFEEFTKDLLQDASLAINVPEYQSEKLLIFDQQLFARLKHAQFGLSNKHWYLDPEKKFIALFVQTQSFSSYLSSVAFRCERDSDSTLS